MKIVAYSLALAAIFVSGGIASAETSATPVPGPLAPGMHFELVDAQSGRVVAEFVTVAGSTIQVQGAIAPAPSRRAFADVRPLTIQQENAAADMRLEGQGAPLHTP